MAYLVPAALVAALILAEHIALWSAPWRLDPPASYIVGTATIGLGMLIYGAISGDWPGAIAFWCIAGAAGMMDVGAYWVRGRLAMRDAVSFQAGQVAGLEEDEHAPHERPAVRD